MSEEKIKNGVQDLSKPGMNYWTATNEVLAKRGGQRPKCPKCGRTMFPIDDHGRFGCRCSIFGGKNE